MVIKIWGQLIDKDSLSEEAQAYIATLPNELPSVEWLWLEMDRVWEQYGLDNRTELTHQNIGQYYSHPIWLVNGIFTLCDEDSMMHRRAIKQFIIEKNLKSVADFGGGSGVLADVITKNNSSVIVDIIEPYPFEFFLKKYSDNKQIKYLKEFGVKKYDCVIAQDVLEHVENPIEMAYQIANEVRDGGFVIFANCFYPVIKCHLPKTFYLRHTFIFIMQGMGLKYLGNLEEAKHVQIFYKQGNLNLSLGLLLSRLAKPLQSPIKFLARIRRLVF